MHNYRRRGYDDKENVCPLENLTENRHFFRKHEKPVNCEHAKSTNKQNSGKFNNVNEDRNHFVEMQEECSGCCHSCCCCEPYCTCAHNLHEAAESKHVRCDDKGKNKTTHASCNTCSSVQEPTLTEHAISTQRADETRTHAASSSPNTRTPLYSSAVEGNYRPTNKLPKELQKQQESCQQTHKERYAEREEHLPETSLLQKEQHTKRLSSQRQPHEKQRQHFQQKECNSQHGAVVSNNSYRRNMSELLRLRRNQAYRRSLEHEYNVRLDTLRDELNARMHELREENKANAKTRFMHEISCHRCLPYGKLANKHYAQKWSASRNKVCPSANVAPVKTTAATTNLSALGESHPYFTQPTVHESNKSKYYNNNKIHKMNRETDKNVESKDYCENDNLDRSRELYAHSAVDASTEMHYCRALQCCPCCGSALVAINSSDTINRLHEHLYSALSECTCCGFVGAVRATCEHTQTDYNDDEDDNAECVREREDNDMCATKNETNDISSDKELQSNYANHVNKTSSTCIVPHLPHEKGDVCSKKFNYLNSSNNKQEKEEQKAVRTVAHGLPIYKTRTSHWSNVDKQTALEKDSMTKIDKRVNTTAHETSVETASLCSPRFGRKTYITDEEYLFYRAQRLAAWEAEGCAERINPPASVADDVYAPLPTRTPRWRIKCNTYFGQDNNNVVCT